MIKSTKFGIKREYDVDIDNCPPQELHKALQKFCAHICKHYLILNRQSSPHNRNERYVEDVMFT